MDDSHNASTIPYSNANTSPSFHRNLRRILNTQNAPPIPLRPRSHISGLEQQSTPHLDVRLAKIDHLRDELQQVALRMESECQVESLQAELNTQHVAYQCLESQMLESTFTLELQIHELKNSMDKLNWREDNSPSRCNRNDEYVTHVMLNEALDELAERIICRVVQLVGMNQSPSVPPLCGVSSSVSSATSPSHSQPTFAQAALTQVATLTTGATPQTGYVQLLPDPVSTVVVPAYKEQHFSDISPINDSQHQLRYRKSILPLESHGQIPVYSKHLVLPKCTGQINAVAQSLDEWFFLFELMMKQHKNSQETAVSQFPLYLSGLAYNQYMMLNRSIKTDYQMLVGFFEDHYQALHIKHQYKTLL